MPLGWLYLYLSLGLRWEAHPPAPELQQPLVEQTCTLRGPYMNKQQALNVQKSGFVATQGWDPNLTNHHIFEIRKL